MDSKSVIVGLVLVIAAIFLWEVFNVSQIDCFTEKKVYVFYWDDSVSHMQMEQNFSNPGPVWIDCSTQFLNTHYTDCNYLMEQFGRLPIWTKSFNNETVGRSGVMNKFGAQKWCEAIE